MNRISWHVPLGIAASLAAHVWIFSLILDGLDAPGPSQAPPPTTAHQEYPLDIEAVLHPQNSFEDNDEPESVDLEPLIIDEEHTIQFR